MNDILEVRIETKDGKKGAFMVAAINNFSDDVIEVAVNNTGTKFEIKDLVEAIVYSPIAPPMTLIKKEGKQ